MKKYNKFFSGILNIYFWVGVNVIGLPIFHQHKLNIYKYNSK